MMMNTLVIILIHVIITIPIVLIALVLITLVERAKASEMGESG